MNKPDAIPAAVKAAIRRYAERHSKPTEVLPEHLAAEILASLGWDAICGCYYFTRSNMFHGVELDGHIHT